MNLKKSVVACALATAALFTAATPARAQMSGDVIRIGFITDMSSVYSDLDGPAGAEAIRMAVADLGGAIDGKKVECWWPTTRTRPTWPRRRRASGSTSRAWTC